MATLRQASDDDLERVDAFYRGEGFGSEASSEHVIYLAEDEGEIVGVVRLVPVEDYLVLRGMMVRSAYRRQGIGKGLLAALVPHMDGQTVYCLPWAHLEDFYAGVGFETIPLEDCPNVLRDRLDRHFQRLADPAIQQSMQTYLEVSFPDGLDFCIMKRHARL